MAASRRGKAGGEDVLTLRRLAKEGVGEREAARLQGIAEGLVRRRRRRQTTDSVRGRPEQTTRNDLWEAMEG